MCENNKVKDVYKRNKPNGVYTNLAKSNGFSEWATIKNEKVTLNATI